MLALVHHHSNSATPGFLQMVAHNFVAHLLLELWKNLLLHLLLELWKNLLLQSFSIFSPAQEVLPLTNLSSPQEKVLTFLMKGANSPWPL
jgi:hypothetical protein